MTNREIDALVAEKVFNCRWFYCDKPWAVGKYLAEKPIYAGDFLNDDKDAILLADWDRSLPKYSTDIAAAWEVMKKLDHLMPTVAVEFDNPTRWGCSLNSMDGEEIIEFIDESAPMAICKAALAAVGHNLSPKESE